MRFDDLPGDRQAEPSAFYRSIRLIVRLVEFFKDMRQLLGRDAHARVTDHQAHLALSALDGQLYGTPAIGELERVRQQVSEHLIDTVFVPQHLGGKLIPAHYPKRDFALVDVLHPEASKGAGLAAVAAEYGLTPAEVMAMGDNHNDLEMLLYAGTSVVMSNAEPELREHERNFYLTGSNDEDGVAAAVERFILTT